MSFNRKKEWRIVVEWDDYGVGQTINITKFTQFLNESMMLKKILIEEVKLVSLEG